MKKLAVLFVTTIFAISLLASCTKSPVDKEQQAQDMVQDLQQSGSIQNGAKVDSFVNEDGDAQISYKNPDESGGGSVALD